MSHNGHMWTASEKEALRKGAKGTAPAATKYLFWSEVRDKFMPHRSRSAIQQQANKMGLKARLFGRNTQCVACGKQGISNRKRKLCYDCYISLKSWRMLYKYEGQEVYHESTDIRKLALLVRALRLRSDYHVEEARRPSRVDREGHRCCLLCGRKYEGLDGD